MRSSAVIRCGRLIVALLLGCASAAEANSLPIVDAVKRGDQAALTALLAQQVDVNAREADGTTALGWAAYRGDVKAATALLRAGATVTVANDYGATPLWLACSRGHAAVVDLLLKAGADPNAALRLGETPLMAAVERGSPDVVNALLAGGADPNARESAGGQTALMWAAAKRDPAIVRALIARGADVALKSKGGFTPLLFAAQQGDVTSAEALLAAGARIDEPAADGTTPLLIAIASDHETLSLFLVERGANVKAVDRRGFTVLHNAATTGMLQLVKAVVARGVDPDVRLMKAQPVGDFGGLVQIGATPFLMAAAAGSAEIMRALVSAGANPLLTTDSRNTSLMAAAALGGGRRNYETWTEAEEKRALEAATLTLQLGVPVNAANDVGQTALHAAAYVGANSVIQFLVASGARMDVMDTLGQTPLSIASNVITEGLGDNFPLKPRTLRESTVALLLKLGATPLAASGVRVQVELASSPPTR
jgi:ankyrin repeat protein